MQEGLSGAVRDVLEFHKKLCPQIVKPVPHIPIKRADRDFCIGFIKEELAETELAMVTGDVPGVADGLADLIYVAIRAALIWGIDLGPVWKEVHRANMSKEGGPTREDNKIIKPPRFVPPDIAGVLAVQPPITI